MPNALSRADFCRASLTGLIGLAACRKPEASAGQKVTGGTVTSSQLTAEIHAPPATPDASAAPATDGVPKRKLGSTGELVSMLGLGGAHIGQKSLSDAEAIQIMHEAIEGGLTFFDNCWDYNEGASQDRMGKALRDGYRQKVFLMTKLDGRTATAANGQLEQSLKQLQTDVIDLVQVHEVIRMTDPDRAFAADGVIGALQAAKKAGKIRFIGFTGHKDPKIHLYMLETARKAGFTFDTVQMPLNVMDAHFKSFEHNVLPVLVQRGIGVLGMKSMGAGDILKSGVVKAEECLRYSLSLATSVVITGIDSKRVLQQDLTLARNFVPLSADERESLLARTAPEAKGGKHELFKTAHKYDGTINNPKWLEVAEI